MRILHWDEMFHPSFGYQINLLAKFQAKEGHEVIILTSDKIDQHPTFSGFGDNRDIQSKDQNYSNQYNVRIIRLPIHTVISGRVIFKRGYIKRIKELNPDVIMCHTNDTLSAIMIAQKYKQINIPIIFDNHMLEMASKNPLRQLFRLYFKWFITPLIKKNEWTVIKTQDDNYVNKCLGIPYDQTPFISFGSDTTLFYPDSNVRRKFRIENEIDQNEFVVVYAGKIDEAKGGKFLAESILEKVISRRKVVFMIVGNVSGEYGNEVEDLFLQSENRLIRFPTQDYTELSKFYQAADLAIFPKQCSLSFFDVQACALPVLSENNNINVDRLKYGNGITFQSEDISDFREKLNLFVDMDNDLLEKYKENSLKFINENYDFASIEKRYTQILLNEVERFEIKKGKSVPH